VTTSTPTSSRAALRDGGPAPGAATTANARLRIVDAALADRETLSGAGLGIADLAVCPMVAFAAENLGAGATEGLESLGAWMGRMQARDSFRVTEPAATHA
jgi:glutathione S-transferase